MSDEKQQVPTIEESLAEGITPTAVLMRAMLQASPKGPCLVIMDAGEGCFTFFSNLTDLQRVAFVDLFRDYVMEEAAQELEEMGENDA